jgi:predicted dehydrogenase
MKPLTPMDRRSFARLSALALAAGPLLGCERNRPAADAIGFAAVGLGRVSEVFATALTHSRHARLAAVVTGHPDTKGTAYAARYNLPASSIYTYDTFNSIRDNKAIDAVYIGLPNSMHADFTLRAAEAGKHVLCEKPMAISSAECLRMIDACRAANVHLMVAYRLWYDPTFARVLSILHSGALGNLQSLRGEFIGSKPLGDWRLNKALSGGGSLLDLGIYPISSIRYFTSEDPIAFTAVTSTREPGPRFAQVEESVEFTLKLPSGILAAGSSSYGGRGVSQLEIHGDKGWLRIEPAYAYDGLRVSGQLDAKVIDFTASGKRPFQFTLEADHFAQCIRSNTTPRTPGELGLKDLQTIEALYAAAGHPLT